jgi:glycerophosphoryl diester phosphodiesterase
MASEPEKSPSQEFLLYAHRGASGYAPENTLASFKRALDMGCERMELDVHLSADGVPVVIHDKKVDRTIDGKGLVESLSLGELKKLDAGVKFSPGFRGERIPTLEEVFEIDKRIKLCIEIKGNGEEETLCHKVVDIVRKYKAEGDTIISSFSRRAVQCVYRIDGNLTTLWLVPRWWFGKKVAVKAHEVGAKFVSGHATNITLKKVNRLHDRGLKVQAWGTKQKVHKIQALLDTGIDGMTSNWPDVVMKLLAARGQKIV